MNSDWNRGGEGALGMTSPHRGQKPMNGSRMRSQREMEPGASQLWEGHSDQATSGDHGLGGRQKAKEQSDVGVIIWEQGHCFHLQILMHVQCQMGRPRSCWWCPQQEPYFHEDREEGGTPQGV